MDAVVQTRRLLLAVLDEQDFGDSVVEAVCFDPMGLLRGDGVDELTRFGAAVGLLVNFNGHIDNADYASALGGVEYRSLLAALEEGLCNTFPVVDAALKAATVSERQFYEALPAVYAEACSRMADHTQGGDV